MNTHKHQYVCASVRGTLVSIVYEVSVSRFSLFDADGLRTAEVLNEIKVIADGMQSMQGSVHRLNQQRVTETDLVYIASHIPSMQEQTALTKTMNRKIDTDNAYVGLTCAQ